MALGGGAFTAQNKVLPGAYINFVSNARVSSVLGDRGVVAMPLILDWGNDTSVFEVTAESFAKDGLKVFGYASDHAKNRDVREIFAKAKKLYAYRLNGGVKAQNTHATAKWSGIRGNDIKVLITANVDDNAKWDVKTILDEMVKDVQTVSVATDLKDNDWLSFKTSGALAATTAGGLALSGGTNKASVTGTEYSSFLAAIQPYTFNIIGCPATDAATIALFVAFTKRMRDDMGVKFQAVVPAMVTGADYEGIIEVINTVDDAGSGGHAMVYWTSGAEAACPVNTTLTNTIYTGEYVVNTAYTQSQLEEAIKNGKIIFHKVGSDIRVLTDVNTLVTTTAEKGDDFKSNQTVRVLDQIACDIATIFNTKYLGSIPNDPDGRASLWNDVVSHHRSLQTIRAIENFDSKNVVVDIGKTKRSVVINDAITPTNAMEQLYMTVVVS